MSRKRSRNSSLPSPNSSPHHDLLPNDSFACPLPARKLLFTPPSLQPTDHPALERFEHYSPVEQRLGSFSPLAEHFSRAESVLVDSCPSDAPRSDNSAFEDDVCKCCSGCLPGGTQTEKAFSSSPLFDDSCVRLLRSCVLSVAAGLEKSPRERFQSHRLQVAGKIQVPDVWVGENRLLEWVSTKDLEEALRPPDLSIARAALVTARRSTIAPSAGNSSFRAISLDPPPVITS